MVIKRIGPMSVAKVAGTLYALVGFLFGALISLIALAGANISGGGGVGALLGAGAIVFFPIIYGCLGFVVTLLAASLYNVVAGWIGGIEMELQ